MMMYTDAIRCCARERRHGGRAEHLRLQHLQRGCVRRLLGQRVADRKADGLAVLRTVGQCTGTGNDAPQRGH